MPIHQARVYFRSFDLDELPPQALPHDPAISDRLTEIEAQDLMHDRHCECQTLNSHERSDDAIFTLLQKIHPLRHVIIDKISWLDQPPL